MWNTWKTQKINFDCYILEGVVKYTWVPNQFDIDVKVLANDIQALLAFKKSSSRTKIISHCTTIFKHIRCVLDQNKKSKYEALEI